MEGQVQTRDISCNKDAPLATGPVRALCSRAIYWRWIVALFDGGRFVAKQAKKAEGQTKKMREPVRGPPSSRP